MKRIDSVQNGSVKNWKKLHTKKEREKTGLFLIEGFHLVEEALKSEIVDTLLITEETDIPAAWKPDNISIVIVTEEIIKLLSETETPQSVIAICKKKEYADVAMEGSFLLIDAVQDPGNLGTMIRTADAAGVTAVILGNGCVDVYNGKAIRSTQGSLFHLPVLKGDLTEWIPRLQEKGITVYGTSLQNAKPYQDIQPAKNTALIVGNEGSGVQKELLSLTDENLYIPIYGQAESLNVSIATGILLYYLHG